jgi:cholesterol oxidase
VLEAGKRWPDEDIPTTSRDLRKFLPEAELYGIQRIEVLDDAPCQVDLGVGI